MSRELAPGHRGDPHLGWVLEASEGEPSGGWFNIFTLRAQKVPSLPGDMTVNVPVWGPAWREASTDR